MVSTLQRPQRPLLHSWQLPYIIAGVQNGKVVRDQILINITSDHPTPAAILPAFGGQIYRNTWTLVRCIV